MNAQEYISSGLLEAYVLGSLSPQETEEVLEAIGKYPEVAAEVAAIEDTVFQMAELQAAPPPPHLQDRIWSAIEASGVMAPSLLLPQPPEKSL